MGFSLKARILLLLSYFAILWSSRVWCLPMGNINKWFAQWCVITFNLRAFLLGVGKMIASRHLIPRRLATCYVIVKISVMSKGLILLKLARNYIIFKPSSYLGTQRIINWNRNTSCYQFCKPANISFSMFLALLQDVDLPQ